MSRSIAPMSGSRTVPAFERSSGNVFRDLGFERPDDELARAMLIAQLGDLVEAHCIDDALRPA